MVAAYFKRVAKTKNPKPESMPAMPPTKPKRIWIPIKAVVNRNNLVPNSSVACHDSPNASNAPFSPNIIYRGNNPNLAYR